MKLSTLLLQALNADLTSNDDAREIRNSQSPRGASGTIDDLACRPNPSSLKSESIPTTDEPFSRPREQGRRGGWWLIGRFGCSLLVCLAERQTASVRFHRVFYGVQALLVTRQVVDGPVTNPINGANWR